MECPAWRPSELTSSPHLATLYGAQEALSDALADLSLDPQDVDESTATDEITALAETFAEGVREAAEGYRESAQAIEDGFGHSTYVSEELEQKADDLDSWADDFDCVDAADPSFPDEPDEPLDGKDPSDDDYDEVADAWEAYFADIETWFDEFKNQVEEASSEVPF